MFPKRESLARFYFPPDLIELDRLAEMADSLYRDAVENIGDDDMDEANMEIAERLLRSGDWQGMRILRLMREFKRSEHSPTAEVSALMGRYDDFRIKAAVFPPESGLGRILGIGKKFPQCPELYEAVKNANYSHPLVAFEYVFNAAKKRQTRFTASTVDFLIDYARSLGLREMEIDHYNFAGIKSSVRL